MNFSQTITAISLTALITFSPSANAQNPTENYIDFRLTSDLSVPIPTDKYLDLIDGNISELRTEHYLIRRRLGTRPVGFEQTTSTKLFTLYFDIFQGKRLLKTTVHNQPKPLIPFSPLRKIDSFEI